MSWIKNQNGKFFVKTAYHIAAKLVCTPSPISSNLQMGKIWKLKIHDRHKLLHWKISWNILQTRSQLKRYIPNIPSTECPLCRAQDETTLHLLRNAPLLEYYRVKAADH